MNAPPVIAAPGKSSTDPDANPPLPERTGISAPVLAFVGLLLLLVVARVAVQWNLPTPFCGLKRLTGVPCPFCGSTRCLQACSSFDFVEAVRWNPLTFLACGGVVLWFVLWVADRVFNRRCAASVWFAAAALKPALIAAVLLNWIYLCLTLP